MEGEPSSSVLPGLHGVQDDAPIPAYSPRLQFSHAVAPTAAAKLPAAQIVQLVLARSSGCARPRVHGTHGVEASASWSGAPAGQPLLKLSFISSFFTSLFDYLYIIYYL